MFINRSTKVFFTVLLVAVIAAATYALAAQNTVPATRAGDGDEVISGYTITNVHYVLDAADPSLIASVTFTTDLAPAVGSTIRIKLVAAGTTWYNCTNAGVNVTCTTTGADVLAADELRIVIAQ